MTPEELAGLHARVFVTPQPWSARDFEGMLSDPTVHLLEGPDGFLLLRLVADEGEILTLAVDPSARRRGTGRALVAQAIDLAQGRGIATLFLEVAADNAAARALYAAAGFVSAGRRPGYYRSPDGEKVDALVLRRANVASDAQERP